MTDVPLRCEACNQIVGVAHLADDVAFERIGGNENTVRVRMTQTITNTEMRIEDHADDCPIRASFEKTEGHYSISGEEIPVIDPIQQFHNVFDKDK